MNTNPSAFAQLSAAKPDAADRVDRFNCREGPRRAPRGRWYSFASAGALVAVGYMDPGNWATALASGARYGYQLLFVVLLARSLMGMLVQWVASRVGVVTGHDDLAQLYRERYSHRTTLVLWLACEVAIIACDVAEVVGSAVALQMLFGMSLTAGVLVSAVATFAMLALQSPGQRPLQRAVTAPILFVGFCFGSNSCSRIRRGAMRCAPSRELLRNAGMLWLAAGVLGVPWMPHNLFYIRRWSRSRGLAR